MFLAVINNAVFLEGKQFNRRKKQRKVIETEDIEPEDIETEDIETEYRQSDGNSNNTVFLLSSDRKVELDLVQRERGFF